MSHKLVVGTTGACKSLLCKIIAREYKLNGIRVAVLDIMQSTDWTCDFQTDDAEKFLAYVKTQRDMVLFIDESGSTVGRYNKPMEWLAIQARHLGHDCYFILQAVTQISPVVRDNCHDAIVFACGDSSVRILADDFREKMLYETEKFQAGEFYIVNRFVAPRKGKIFPPVGKRVDIAEIPVTIGRC